MKCTALVTNLEQQPRRDDPSKISYVLTFCDTDTGETHRTYLDQLEFVKLERWKTYELTVNPSLYRSPTGSASLTMRVAGIAEIKEGKAPFIQTPVTK